MKIVALETHIVAVPPPHIGGMYWLFVKLKTDCGIEGVGEIYAATFGPKAMLPIIEDVFERYLLNQDPHHIERFFRQAYSSGFTQRPDLTMMGVVSGLEMACWDIIGKAANKPVYELLGGKVNERLRSYTYLYPVNSKGEYDYDDPDLAAECAIENMNKGFTAVKFDPAGPYTAYSGHQISLEVLERCETFCRKIREAVGDKCDLLFGTHGQMVPSSATAITRDFCASSGFADEALGRSTLMPCTAAVVSRMKMMRSTSITSIIGVTFGSDLILSDERFNAIGIPLRRLVFGEARAWPCSSLSY